MTTDAQFAEELTLFGDIVQRFAETELLPYYEEWNEEEIFPREVWRKMGAHGLLGVDLPEQYNGAGADFRFSSLISETMCRVNCSAISVSLTVHSDIVAHYVLNNGTELQRQRYLPGMVSGDCVGAIAMSEPAAGSDLQGIRTTARCDGDEYVINGSKTFITNGQHCDMVIVAARTNMNVRGAKGTTLFIVDADAPGFSRGRNLEKIGLHASDTSELFFNEVRVPKSAVLGEVDAGFMILMQELRRERLAIAAAAVAGAEGILDTTISYVSEREAFGASLAQLQNTRFGLARAATDIRINRSFIEECKAHLLEGTLDVATVSMAKVSATELQNRIADVCLQMHGGYGYMREYAVSRAYVDSRIQRIYGGANEIMLELIARDLLD